MTAGPSHLRLEVISGNALGETILVEDELVIGRHTSGGGKLSEDEEISRQHARISREAAGEYAIEDLGSSNGTFINGLRIQSPRLLSLGDSIETGATTLVVREIVQPVQPSVGEPTRAADIPASVTPLSSPTVSARVPAEQQAASTPPLKLHLEVDFDACEARIALGDGEQDETVRMVFQDGGWRTSVAPSDGDR